MPNTFDKNQIGWGQAAKIGSDRLHWINSIQNYQCWIIMLGSGYQWLQNITSVKERNALYFPLFILSNYKGYIVGKHRWAFIFLLTDVTDPRNTPRPNRTSVDLINMLVVVICVSDEEQIGLKFLIRLYFWRIRCWMAWNTNIIKHNIIYPLQQ